MNKTLLLIIVDFLFLNLIALTRWEQAEPARTQRPPVPAVGANAATRSDDLVDAMRKALADQQAADEDLGRQLAAANQTLNARERTLALVQTERNRLSSSLEQTGRTAAELSQKLAAASQQADLTQDQLAQLKRELDEKKAEAERQRSELADLRKAQSDSVRKIQDLTLAVVVSGAENQHLQEQAAELKTQVEAERAERAQVEQGVGKLAQGVGRLAETSGALSREIRENQPISANVLYEDFLSNEVQTTFAASRRGLLGHKVERSKTVPTILATDGRQIYALVHVDDTIFSFAEYPENWSELDVAFDRPASGYHGSAAVMEFLAADPRVVAVPVDAAQAVSLGVKVYALAKDPFKFSEAVLISGRGKGYGTVGFKLDPIHPGYVKVDNRLFKRLFGDFAPSRGDLVLSQTGELLGVMVNSDYCALVREFIPSATMQTGEQLSQQTGPVLDRLGADFRALPLDLQ